MRGISRRRVLRGMLNGSAVSVALPLLDCFLNSNATALADGSPLPVRFGTWNWGLGMNKGVFVPKTVGKGFDLPAEIEVLAPVRDKINVFTNFNAYLDGAPNLCHYTGWIILHSGSAPLTRSDRPGETIDVTVAKKIGTSTRFQNLTVAATGDPRDTQSYESANSINNAEGSPLGLYTTIFGPDFQDPNAHDFRPSPNILVRKSVLSSVLDGTNDLKKAVGAADKQRLDQYFTNLRELEKQLDRQLTKPEPRQACIAPHIPEASAVSTDYEMVAQRHKMMAELLAMAVACDQTRVINMNYSNALAATTKLGYDKPHHAATHEEADSEGGYQPMSSWFSRQAFASWRDYVLAFDKIKEGDGTLLDNMLLYASTDVALAKLHTTDGLPMFTAGRAGGKLKTGYHVSGQSTTGCRLGYTLMKVLGLDISSWGSQSNSTSNEIGEIIA